MRRGTLFLIGLFFLYCGTGSMAQETFKFPKKGCFVGWMKKNNGSFLFYNWKLKKFKDADSVFYMEYNHPYQVKESKIFCFVDFDTAKSIYLFLKQNKEPVREKWVKDFLSKTGVYGLDKINRYNDCWTYFIPKAYERGYKFDLSTAMYAFKRDRDRDEKIKNITPEQWITFFKAVKVVLPLMPDGDNRTLYEQMVDPNNTRKQ